LRKISLPHKTANRWVR